MNSFQSRTAFALFAIVSTYQAIGQTLASNDALPDSPGAVMQAAVAATRPAELQGIQGTSRVQGVVLDVQGNPVPEANVILTAPGKLGEKTVIAASDGTFSFTAVPAGLYRITISSPGLVTYNSSEFLVKPDEIVEAPKSALRISTASTVEVTATPDQIAEAQVHEQEKQRVFGVFPNFYTSYIWNAEPMPARQKYKLALRTLIDPANFVVTAAVAGAEQYNGTYPGYGPGIEGYGKCYGAALADTATSRIVGSAILPSLLHQDPRYFYQGTGGIRSRAWHAISSTLVTRGDNGKNQPNYSHLLGSLVAGAVANTYHPDSSRGAGLTFETLGIVTAGNAAGNLFREFVLRGFVPSVPHYANGKQ
jgi:Carboxypeptidase regulatory-like domain